MATFLALLVVMAAVGLLLRAFVVDAFAQTATAGPTDSDPTRERPTPRPTAKPGRTDAPSRTASAHRLRPDALVWNAIDDLQVRRLLSGSTDSH